MKKGIILGVIVAICALIVAYALFIHQDLDPRKAHGTVDIKDSLLSFERSGKIIQLTVEEGAQVKQGDVLARLDSTELDHQMRIQYAQCEAAQALLTQYQNGYLKEERDSALALVNKSQAAVDLANITYQRNASLLKSRSISKQDFDSAKASYDQARATLAEAQAQLALLDKGYRDEIISAQAAQVAACKAQLAYLNYQVTEQGVITAPFSGTVRTRTHELSDFVGAGETIFALTDEDHKKIRIYLSDAQLQFIKLGQTVSVEVPYQSPLVGTISFISPTAMFTPKSVQTEDLRADLIYEVSVEVADPQHVLRFGQAITVYLQGTAPDHGATQQATTQQAAAHNDAAVLAAAAPAAAAKTNAQAQ